MSSHPDDDLPRRKSGPLLLATAGATALVIVGLFGALGIWRGAQRGLDPGLLARIRERTARPPVAATVTSPAPEVKRLVVTSRRLARNQTLAQALFGLELAETEIRAVVAALDTIFPFKKVRPGDQIRLERRERDRGITRLTYRQGPADEWIVQPREDGTLNGEKRAVELTTERARVSAAISSSLYETLQKAGEDPALAVDASDVLAWDVDFYQDVRAGDAIRILVEKVYADGRLLRYGNVLAVEYDGQVTGRKRLFRYTDPSGQTSYFDDDGNSARRGFLKSPLKYAHLTSRYGSRFHPLLQYRRAHQGVDYGAPEGTPIWAVGDGAVEKAGSSGGCGKSVTLRHRNGLETLYCHLSRVAVAAGSRVSQKQIIGYVGQTGIATGPHLHYAVKRHGSFVNPLQLQIPRDAPVPAEWKADFLEKIGPLRQRLDAIPTV